DPRQRRETQRAEYRAEHRQTAETWHTALVPPAPTRLVHHTEMRSQGTDDRGYGEAGRGRRQSKKRIREHTAGFPFPVITPVPPKDQRTLSFCVRGIRASVRPPPSRVVLISGSLERAVMREVARLGVEWLDEARLLAEAGLRERLAVRAGGVDRSGWIVQQILKWEARRHVRGEFYLVVDADTVFLRPTGLVEGGRGVLFERPGGYAPYLATYARLLGRP